jgi:hypothetical protein
MFIPITIDDYVKEHLENNPGENEKIFRVRLEATLEDFQKGIKCACGNDIWVARSASAGNGCFSCITGKKHPAGEYEIDTAIEKRDKYGRRHIDEMDPMKINGIFDDEGYEINKELIKKPSLCLTCVKNDSQDWEDDVLCNLSRHDQNNSDNFICNAYLKIKN